MLDIRDLFLPQWGVEPWLLDSWSVLNDEEQMQVKNRLDELFANGLPIHMTEDKKLYMHLFSLLTQFEVLGIQTPLKFESRMTKPDFRKRMRQQLADEVFHTLAFTKIAFELAAPLAMPPLYSKQIERFCHLVSGEENTQIAVLLTNLVAEGFIEEIFAILKKHHIAPHLFSVILEDEKRHISDVEVYKELGLPPAKMLMPKLALLEEELITNVFFQPTYIEILASLIGTKGCEDLLESINKKYTRQLATLNLKPTKKWAFFCRLAHNMIKSMASISDSSQEIEISTTRKALMSQWQDPTSPTMSSLISLDVSKLCFFDKKYPSDSLNCLVLQAISEFYADNPQFRLVYSHDRIVQYPEIGIVLAVNLPGCGDHLGMIELSHCHTMPISDIAEHVKLSMQIMTYCHRRAMELKKRYPHLMDVINDFFEERHNNIFAPVNPGKSYVTVSNIGYWGFEAAISPLMPGEFLKFTLTQVERKPVWNKKTNEFEAQDRLPIGISVDHRVFDGNSHVAKILQTNFDKAFDNMNQAFENQNRNDDLESNTKLTAFIEKCEKLLAENIDYGFRYLLLCSHHWRGSEAVDQDLALILDVA